MILSRLGIRGPSSARVPSFPPSAGEKTNRWSSADMRMARRDDGSKGHADSAANLRPPQSRIHAAR